MSATDENQPISEARRKRINRLKKIIITSVLVCIFVPMTLCVVLLIQMNRMGHRVDSLADQVKQLSELNNHVATVTTDKTDRWDSEEQLSELNSEELYAGELYSEEPDSGNLSRTDWPADEDTLPEVALDNASGMNESGQSQVKMRHVYLTFDDGPSVYTDDILDILATYNVKASFFVLPKEGYDEEYKRIVEEGHTLGMHSYTHVYKDIYKNLDAFMEDVSAIQNFLYEKTGIVTNYYRFPGGSSNAYCKSTLQTYLTYLQGRGIQYYDWNISSCDSEGPILSRAEVAANVLRNIGRYDDCMILMHDAQSKRSTVDALPEIIETILAMENTEILPITDESVPIQHRTLK